MEVTIPKSAGSVSRSEDFESFYRRKYGWALGLARALTNARVAEDIVQDAFWAAYEHWSEIENPTAWVRRVIVNRSQSTLRRGYAEARAMSRLGGRRDARPEPSADTADFWKHVRKLPRRQSEAVVLCYLEDFSIAEAAVFLGCSEATVRVHLHRARRTLADRYGAEEER